MNRRSLIALLGLFAMAALSTPAHAASTTKGHYRVIEVQRFAISPGLDFPQDYLVALMEDVVEQLGKSKRFQQVLRQGETPAQANAPALKLTGTITKFKKGNRALRYAVGFGAGKTSVKANVQFIDQATGEVLFQKDVDGKVWIGFMGGESSGATRGLAKEVAKVAKNRF
jgi:hypothetical protein